MKQKPGLHKKVSSIFDGAPYSATAPQNGAGGVDAGDSAAGRIGQMDPNDRSTAVLTPAAPGYGEPIGSRHGAFESERSAKSPLTAKGTSKRDSMRNYLVPMLVTVLLFVGLLTAANLIGLLSGGKEAAPVGADSREAVSPESYAARIYWQAPPLVPEEIRDITRAGDTSEYQQRLVVRGITYSDNRASAIIGKAIVRVGDEVMGARVLNIGRNHVEFEMKGKRWKQQVEK
jgi:hypothetical protein